MLTRERELVAELSHRLRTPLTTLRMRVDHVEDVELAEQLRLDINGLTGVVNDVIREARGAIDGPASCNLAEVFRSRSEFWSVLAEDQERPWHFKQGEGDFAVAVAANDLEAAFDVLFENVFSHTPDGSPVDVGFEGGAGHVRVWVSDGGDGLDPHTIIDGLSSAGSTGLGLGIARRTVEEADGHMTVRESKLGGAEIELSLPLISTQGRPSAGGSRQHI